LRVETPGWIPLQENLRLRQPDTRVGQEGEHQR